MHTHRCTHEARGILNRHVKVRVVSNSESQVSINYDIEKSWRVWEKQ